MAHPVAEATSMGDHFSAVENQFRSLDELVLDEAV
jgi:hypothetical protein